MHSNMPTVLRYFALPSRDSRVEVEQVAARVAMRRLEHLYYKHNDLVALAEKSRPQVAHPHRERGRDVTERESERERLHRERESQREKTITER